MSNALDIARDVVSRHSNPMQYDHSSLPDMVSIWVERALVAESKVEELTATLADIRAGLDKLGESLEAIK